ncbi:MAG: hypothetical protein ACI4T8_01315 [Christensenellales bacterium]
MKKFLKTFLAVAVLIPCSLLFVACGQLDTQAKVNTSGNYKEATLEDVTKYATENETTIDSETKLGYQISMDMVDKDSNKVTVNLYTTYDAEGKFNGFACKLAGKAKTEENKVIEANYTCYIKDSTVYLKGTINEEKAEYQFKAPLVAETIATSVGGGAQFLAAMFSDIVNIANAVAAEAGFKIEMATSGSTAKYHLASEAAGIDVYYVFKDGMLTGLKGSLKDSEDGTSFEFVMKSFSGSIKYPSNLEDYNTDITKLGTDAADIIKELVSIA